MSYKIVNAKSHVCARFYDVEYRIKLSHILQREFHRTTRVNLNWNKTYLPHFNLSAREHIALRRQLSLRLLPIGLTFPSGIKNM